VGRERFDKLIFPSVDWVFLLEEGLKLVLGLFGGVLLHVDGVLEHFGVVHGAPSNERAVVREGGELVLLDVAMHRLLDVEVLAHASFL
jgi:hypothetical protein